MRPSGWAPNVCRSPLGEPAAGGVGHSDGDLAVGKLARELGDELVDDVAHALGGELGELDHGVEAVAEFRREEPLDPFGVLVAARLSAEAQRGPARSAAPALVVMHRTTLR